MKNLMHQYKKTADILYKAMLDLKKKTKKMVQNIAYCPLNISTHVQYTDK